MISSNAFPPHAEIGFEEGMLVVPHLESFQRREGNVFITNPPVRNREKTDFSGSTVSMLLGNDQDDRKPNVIVRVKQTSRIHLICLQSWQGAVTKVYDDYFEARLFDRSVPGNEEWVELDKEEVSFEDRTLIRVGAVFYWSIGYADKKSGRERVSDIRFRRLPTWSPEDIDAAKCRAEILNGVLKWCEP